MAPVGQLRLSGEQRVQVRVPALTRSRESAETPSAGHETAPSCFWLGVAVPARGVTVPEGEVAWGWGATGPEGDVFSSPMVQPARQRVRPAAPGFPCPAGNRFVLAPVRFVSCCQSGQRGVVSPYAVFDMPAIYTGS